VVWKFRYLSSNDSTMKEQHLAKKVGRNLNWVGPWGALEPEKAGAYDWLNRCTSYLPLCVGRNNARLLHSHHGPLQMQPKIIGTNYFFLFLSLILFYVSLFILFLSCLFSYYFFISYFISSIGTVMLCERFFKTIFILLKIFF
jgi:hypothetical protein